MSRRWNWDFEEERRPAASVRTPIPPPSPSPLSRSREIHRRRRILAGSLALAAIALVIAVIALSGSSARSPARAGATAGAGAAAVPRGSHRPPGEGEGDLRGAVSAVLAYTPFVREGSARVPEVALTFDDGPGPYTPSVLAVLERLHVHATFFAIGRMERWFSASTAREIRDGDAIGDHTETHPMMALLSPHDQYEQLFEQAARVELLGAPRPDLFRPPYGSFDATTMRELRRLHMLMVLWSVDTADYQQPGVEAIVQRALAGAHPGAIILLHDGGGDRTETAAALPGIISGLRSRGLTPVTVPRLLRDDPPPEGQPLPSGLAGD
jgi:peptidoglycan/xylan/chitin deacetylase (PgdA/CDA1 family)